MFLVYSKIEVQYLSITNMENLADHAFLNLGDFFPFLCDVFPFLCDFDPFFNLIALHDLDDFPDLAFDTTISYAL